MTTTCRRSSVLCLTALLLMAVLLTPDISVQSGEVQRIPGALSGTVCHDGSRKFLENVDVVLCKSQDTVKNLLERGLSSDMKRPGSFYQAYTDEAGVFEIPSIDISTSSSYVLMLQKPGYRPLIVQDITIVSGASLADRLTLYMEPALTDRNDPVVRNIDELPLPDVVLPPRPERCNKGSHLIFATREGLVGGTTANGHIITESDHFVALPSRRSLCESDATKENEVLLTYNGRSVRVPVWDVGPWNTKDDYWNPSEQREMWKDLSQYIPEAQAAFQNGYNDGRDGFGRTVKNAAGIDLADGVFLDDLAMTDNDWIEVQFLWQGSSSLKGDIDSDGAITSADGDLCLKITLNLTISYTASPSAHEPTEAERSAADMNGDGAVGVDDAVMILKESVRSPR